MKKNPKLTTRRPGPSGAPIPAYSRLFAPIRGWKSEPFLPFRPRAFGFVPENILSKYGQIPLDTAPKKPNPQIRGPGRPTRPARRLMYSHFGFRNSFGPRPSDFGI